MQKNMLLPGINFNSISSFQYLQIEHSQFIENSVRNERFPKKIRKIPKVRKFLPEHLDKVALQTASMPIHVFVYKTFSLEC